MSPESRVLVVLAIIISGLAGFGNAVAGGVVGAGVGFGAGDGAGVGVGVDAGTGVGAAQPAKDKAATRNTRQDNSTPNSFLFTSSPFYGIIQQKLWCRSARCHNLPFPPLSS